jgi:hypothetical protein
MTMRLLSLAVILGTLVSAQVQTNPKRKRYSEAEIIWSGNHIYELCQHFKTERVSGSLGPGCMMYIAGAAQTLMLNDDAETTMPSPCPGKRVTIEQITDVVIKWMDDHPEKRDLPAPYIVMKSLNEAFPCT